MKNISNFLIPNFNFELSEKDKKEIKKDLWLWITKKITRKKFRKKSVVGVSFDDILSKIRLSISENKPIKLVFLFWWYKHFWSDSHQKANWAEFFNILFLIDLLKPVLTIYKPWVIFDYASEDVIITKMNNYPKESLELYAESFKELLEYFWKYFPENFEMNYVRTWEKYNRNELFQKIDEKLENCIKEFKSAKPEEIENRLKRSYRSVMFNWEKDYSDLNEEDKKDLIIKSKCVEDLFYEVEDWFIWEYYYWNENIPLVWSWWLSDENIDNWLTLWSTYSSSVDFWIWKGVFEIRGEKIIPRVLSKNQYFEVKNNLETIKLDFDFKNKNFDEVEILKTM